MGQGGFCIHERRGSREDISAACSRWHPFTAARRWFGSWSTRAPRSTQRALAGYEKALGLEDRSTPDTVHNLGDLRSEHRKLAEAETMYQRALAGREKVLGPEHNLTLQTVNKSMPPVQEAGETGGGGGHVPAGVSGERKGAGPEHTLTLDTVSNLGILYTDKGKMAEAEAEAMYVRALVGYEKALGPTSASF
jgi:tetratricopeptide (TPR) repeat protein